MYSKRLAALTLFILAACGGESSPPDDAAAEAPREVAFTATDFAFEGPASVEGGLVTLVLNNEAETWHHLQLVRLPDGMTMEDFGAAMAQMQPGTPIPDWYHEAGGVNPPAPGEPARVTMWLEPGEYAVLCLVDTPDRIPHVMKGMVQPLTVTAPTHEHAELPASDLSLSLTDYAFGFSSPPTSGTHVIRVENLATQGHEIALFRFLPGKTMDDIMIWGAAYEGPAPIEPVGGVPAIAPGQVVNVEVALTPGEYVALCFLPDATDGAPHLVHGMVLPFTVS